MKKCNSTGIAFLSYFPTPLSAGKCEIGDLSEELGLWVGKVEPIHAAAWKNETRERWVDWKSSL